MELTRRAEPLRLVAQRLTIPELRLETAQAGVNETLRVSILYENDRVPASVATLYRRLGNQTLLKVVYDRYNREGQPFSYEFTLPPDRYQKLHLIFRQNRFDDMDDEPELPSGGIDLWLVERGSGTFHHDIVLSPQTAKGNHRELVLAIKAHLPEAVRELAS